MTDTLLKQPSLKLRLFWLLEDGSSLVVPLLLFGGVLSLPTPLWLGEAARYDFWGFGVAIALLFYGTFRLPGRLGRALSLSALLTTFALPLARLWHTGASDSFIIGGLLPFSDAAIYYGDARNILMGGTMGEWSPQRPFFPGILATLLAATQQNLQISLAIFVAMNAIACFFVAREMQKTHGATVAALISVQVFLYYRVFIGKTVTEHLGLALGLLGFALLWRCASNQRLGTGWVGLFLLAFALNARIGTVFVLPTVILWGVYTFRRLGRFSWLVVMIGGFGAVFLASAMNLVLLKFVGMPNGNPPFANFSFVLYGIATHTNWYQVMLDHPELNNLGNVERVSTVYDFALEVIRQQPFRLVTGILRVWKDFFFGDRSWFTVPYGEKIGEKTIFVDLLLRPLALLGLWGCLRNWKTPAASLLIAMVVGAFLSIPLLPLFDAGIRPYTATVIILFVLSSLGFRVLCQYIVQPIVSWFWRYQKSLHPNWLKGVILATSSSSRTKVTQRKVESSWLTSSTLIFFGITLALLSFIGPVIIHQLASVPQLPPNFVCPPNQQGGLFSTSPGSGINLVSNNTIRQSSLPEVRIKDFRQGLTGFSPWAPKEKVSLKKLPKNITFVDAGFINTSGIWLVAESHLVPKHFGMIAACGQVKRLGPELVIFQATTLNILPQSWQAPIEELPKH